jgi:hypothetical protein
VLHHRDPLFACAIQLLDDESAAQQVVLEALSQAVQGPLGGADSPRALAEAAVDEAGDQRLQRGLDRLVVRLAVARLKALAVVSGGRSGRHDHEADPDWPSSRDSDGGAGLADAAGKGGPLSSFSGPSFAPDGGRPSTVSSPLPSAISGGTSGAGLAPAGEPGQLQRTAHVLAQLPTETRLTLLLVVMQGRSLAEAAELLGCGEPTCRFWLGHGLKQMRRALQRDLIEDEFVSQKARLLMSPGAYNDLRRSKKAAARA